MANLYFIGGSGSNWSTSGNWDLVSGGVGGYGPPTDSDNAFIDSNSPSLCTVTADSSCLSLTISAGKTITITSGRTLEMKGSLTATGSVSSRIIINSSIPSSIAYVYMNTDGGDVGDIRFVNATDITSGDAGLEFIIDREGTLLRTTNWLNYGLLNNCSWAITNAAEPIPGIASLSSLTGWGDGTDESNPELFRVRSHPVYDQGGMDAWDFTS